MLRFWEEDTYGCGQTVHTLVAENDRLRIAVTPYDGGRLTSLWDKRAGFEHIWVNERNRHLRRTYAANYDDTTAFGLEEAFPTVHPCPYGDAVLPFFGETWTLPWNYEVLTEPDGLCIRLWCETSITPARVEKRFVLRGQESVLHTEYRIENIGFGELPYLFCVHPSLRLTPQSSIEVPAGAYETGWMYPENAAPKQTFEWPKLGGYDLSRALPPEENCCFNFYTRQVAGGRYALWHPAVGTGLTIRFDPVEFRSLSLWLSYGGWRGHHCVMSEMFTCWPINLADAMQEGQHEVLAAGQSRTYTVAYELMEETVAPI